jgi:hypothetical protein
MSVLILRWVTDSDELPEPLAEHGRREATLWGSRE